MDRLISEKSVMEVIYGCDWFIDEEHAEVIKERIKAIPSAEPKTGHWINAKVGKLFPSNDFKCSECGNLLDFDGVNCGRGDAKFCPNCGARMFEPQESEDKK